MPRLAGALGTLSLGALVALVGGCNEQTIGVRGTAPTAVIDTPEAGAEWHVSEPVILSGRVTDRDVGEQQLSVTWSSTLDGILAPGLTPDEDGFVSFETTLAVGSHTLTMRVEDSGGLTGEDTVAVTVTSNRPPEVVLSEPTAGTALFAGTPILLSAIAADVEDPPEALRVWWRIQDGEQQTPEATPDSTGLAIGSLTLPEGPHILVATARDTDGATGTTTRTLQVGPPNTAPSCAIEAPIPEEGFPLGQSVTLRASASDLETAPSQLLVSARSSIDGELGGATPTSAGVVLMPLSLAAGSHSLTLTVEDEAGAQCTDVVLVRVSTPPDIEIAAPTDLATLDSASSAVLTGTVTDSEDQPGLLAISVSSNPDGALATTQPDSAGEYTVTLPSLSLGQHLLTATVTDLAGLTANESITVFVNSAPGAPVVTISPALPSTAQPLNGTISVGSLDPDAGPAAISYAWTWALNGVDQANYSGSTAVQPGDTSRDQVWTATVIASDGASFSPPATASVTIQNSPPSVSAPTLGPAALVVGQTATCTPGAAADPDGDQVTLGATWALDGSPFGGSNVTQSVPASAVGQSLTCTVTPFDGTDYGAPQTSSPLTLLPANASPSTGTPTIAPAVLYANTAAVCVDSGTTDPDGDPVTLAYSWTVSGVSVPVATDTLSSALFGRGDVITCAVTPSDGAATGSSVTSAGVTVANSPPIVGIPSLGPSGLVEGQTASCVAGATSDIDGDTVSVVTTWSLDGAAFGGSTNSQLIPLGSAGQSLTCTVTPSDGIEVGGPQTSNPLTPQSANSAPSTGTPLLSPSPAFTDTPVTCQDVGTTDPEGDPVTLAHTWTVSGAPSAVTGGTLPATSFARGDVLVCSITPSDGVLAGPPGTASLTVSNRSPTTSAPTITPAGAVAGDPLTCSAGTSADADGDPVVLGFSCLVNGAVVASGAAWQATGSAGTSVICRVTPTDGTDQGLPADSAPLFLGQPNGRPVVSGVAVGPAPVFTNTTASCTGTVTDPEGDPTTLAYQWFISGVLTGETAASLDSSLFVKDDTLGCIITASDAGGPGAPGSSPTITVQNTPPGPPSVSVQPTAPFEQDNLGCYRPTDSVDIDQDPVTYTYSWTRNGVLDPQMNTANVPGFNTTQGEVWACSITPNDGDEDGTAATDAVTIGPPCVLSTWWGDQDGDGYGGSTWGPVQACTQPGWWWVTLPGDCDDSDTSVNPGAVEVCDSIDQDCDPLTTGCVVDSDGDGDPDSSDCAPNNPAIYNGAPEVCDSIDNNCDPSDDLTQVTYYWDSDQDGYGLNNVSTVACAPFNNYDTTVGGDCDDALAWVNPASPELCAYNLDEDCDGQIDEGCEVCGDNVCSGTEECMEGSCPSDCCLEYEDFSFSAGWTSTPWYVPTGQLDIDEIFVNDVPSYASGVARVTGDYLRHDSNYVGTPMFGTGIGTIYARFADTPPGTPVTLRIKFRCQVGGHLVWFTGSNGGQTSRSCSSSWQEATLFTSASILSAGYWAVTIGDGLVEDIIDIDFIGIE